MEKKYCALSFDDGPNVTTTVRMLDVLEKHGVTASFFILGKNIGPQTEGVIDRMVRMGCTVENHSFSHSHMTRMDAGAIADEVAETSRLIQERTGRMPEFFRPPFIDVDEKVYSSVDLPFIEGKNCLDWDGTVSAERRHEMIMDFISDGTIFLLHDFEENDATVEVVDRIIPELKNMGYAFVTVPELFAIKKVDPKVRGKLWSQV